MAKMTLKIPKLGVSMQEGTLIEWFVTSGERISMGQKLYAIESEKSAMEIESPFAGTIKLLVEAGPTMKVGTPIAEIET